MMQPKTLKGAYSPAEDSWLMLECVEVRKGESVLDLGCGTGIQGINALEKGAGKVVFADIIPEAIKNARQNLAESGFEEKAEFIVTDLFQKIPEKQKFDLIVFNPPYVPSENQRHREVDGGREGREVLDRFLEALPERLEKGGRSYFLQTSLNREQGTGQRLRERGMVFEVVARKKLFFEELMVFKAWKKG